MSQDDLVARLSARNAALLEHLSLRVEFEGDGPVVRTTVETTHLRSHGIMHGGVACTLLDTAMGAAAYAATDGEEELVTVQLEIHFIRPAWHGEAIKARGHVRHAGRKTIVVSGDVMTEAGELIATGGGTFIRVQIPDKPGDALQGRQEGE